MNCWEFLELSPDSEEKTIKRRYAQLLKHYRPDDDPSAFQRLREAYDQAMQMARWNAYEAFDDEQTHAPLASEPSAAVEAVSETVRTWDFAGYSLSALENGLVQAESDGVRQVFERALLDHCLAEFPASRERIDWALARLHWFSLGQCSELSPDALDRLAAGLTREALEELSRLLGERQEHVFLERLEQTQAEPWLQAFDRRAGFQQGLVNLLLERSEWSAELFERVCQVCAWDDTRHAGEDYQWHALVNQAQAAAYEKRLRGFMVETRPSSPEQYAVWALLKPMAEIDRNELMERLGSEDWQACSELSDTLQYRYPQLLERFAGPDLDTWRKRLPALSGEGWAHSRLALWLLLVLAMLPMALNEKDGVLNGALAATMLATGLLFISIMLFKGWQIVLSVLDPVDRWLSRWVLPGGMFMHGRGLLLLRHLLPAASLCFVLIAQQKILGTVQGSAAALLLFVGVSYYMHCAVQGVSLLGLVLQKLHRVAKWLVLAALMAVMAIYMYSHWSKVIGSGAMTLGAMGGA